MNIIIIGTGNVATVLGTRLHQAGHNIIQVLGRREAAAIELASRFNAEAITAYEQLQQHADLYLIAISDNALYDIHKQLQLNNALVVHTAGSVSREVLKNCSTNYGVLYPLQSLRNTRTDVPVIPLYIDANTKQNQDLLLSLATTISPIVHQADDEQRLRLHISAVFVNNFTNHLYVLAELFCNKHQLNFSNLLPLIEETTHRLQNNLPSAVQTGPAVRHDTATIQKHLTALESEPLLKNIYTILSSSIQELK